ncbi:MAG: UDP-2,3-diacylglucosamine diphosphatase [Betaproteobacteria bacterium]|nr:UDP-2,3-diacylglucosamine diphosphatase [Betaproteobacteria bacterium]
MQRALFVSDLHLTSERPAANETFFAFLEQEVPGADALYILGDLFEYWIGDDDLVEPLNAVVAGFLANVARRSTPVFLMHGNRDFLLAQTFCQASGAQMLTDPTLVDLFGARTLLMHGDTLCTDDVAYQDWRRLCRGEIWQASFLAKPLEARRTQMLVLRARSEEDKRTKLGTIMDVNQDAVREALRAQGCTRLIHGHTHRPGHHDIEVDGRECERWVLTDWYVRGGYLEVSAAGAKLVSLPWA